MRSQHRSPWKLALTSAAAALCCLVQASASVATQPVGATSSPSLTRVTPPPRAWRPSTYIGGGTVTGRAGPTGSPCGSATVGSSVGTGPRSASWA